MLGLAVLLGFYLLGMLLKFLLHIPLPPNVIGLILFTFSLFMKWVRLEWVEQSAQFLIRHMSLFFAPFIVGTIAFWPLITQHAVSIVVSLFGSILVVLLVTGWVLNMFSRKNDREPKRSSGGSL